MWALDPIDGTKGFMRGGQYAVCLALIVDSVVQVGVIGCPNLPLVPSNPTSSTPTTSAITDSERGAIFVAVRGQGAYSIPISSLLDPTATATTNHEQPLRIPPSSTVSAAGQVDTQFLESVESGHSAHSFNALVASALGVTKPPNRMDSQAKYCVLARGGEGNVYLRMPVGKGYQEKIWVS